MLDKVYVLCIIWRPKIYSENVIGRVDVAVKNIGSV